MRSLVGSLLLVIGVLGMLAVGSALRPD